MSQKSATPFSNALELISFIEKNYPYMCEIGNFFHSHHDPEGFAVSHWNYNIHRLLFARWERNILSVRQRLIVNDFEDGITSLVTWSGGNRQIIWNNNGEARLLGDEAHTFWQTLQKLPEK